MNREEKSLHNMNTDDFNAMRSMLSEIELKLLQLPPLKQKGFYAPIQAMIFEAWADACNVKDDFLYNDPFDSNGEITCQMLLCSKMMLEALKSAEAALEFAGADILVRHGDFVPTTTLGLREVRKAIAEATKKRNH